jgi:hypothetical protein
VIERRAELVDRAWSKRVAHLGAVEGDPNGLLSDCSVIGDIGEREAGDRPPRLLVEEFGDHRSSL